MRNGVAMGFEQLEKSLRIRLGEGENTDEFIIAARRVIFAYLGYKDAQNRRETPYLRKQAATLLNKIKPLEDALEDVEPQLESYLSQGCGLRGISQPRDLLEIQNELQNIRLGLEFIIDDIPNSTLPEVKKDPRNFLIAGVAAEYERIYGHSAGHTCDTPFSAAITEILSSVELYIDDPIDWIKEALGR